MPEPKTPHEQFMELLGRIASFGPGSFDTTMPPVNVPRASTIGPMPSEPFDISDPTAGIRSKAHELAGTENFLPSDLLSLIQQPKGPEGAAAYFNPATTAQSRALARLAKYSPEVMQNIGRELRWTPDVRPGGSALKRMFEDPITGEKVMFKPTSGYQGEAEPVISGITHVAQKISGVKRASPPAMRVTMTPSTLEEIEGIPMENFMEGGALQRFIPNTERLMDTESRLANKSWRRGGEGLKRTARGDVIIPSVSLDVQKEMARKIPSEYLVGLSDRQVANTMVDPLTREAIPIDMGLGFETGSRSHPEGIRGRRIYTQFLDPKNYPHLKSAFEDAVSRMLAEGTQPYGPFIDLMKRNPWPNYDPGSLVMYQDQAHRFLRDRLEKLADPNLRQELLLSTLMRNRLP